jgi:hypothetical protein
MKSLVELMLDECQNKKILLLVQTNDGVIYYPFSNFTHSAPYLTGYDFMGDKQLTVATDKVVGFVPMNNEEEENYQKKTIETKKNIIDECRKKFNIEYKYSEDLLYYNPYTPRDCRLMYLFNVNNKEKIYEISFLRELKQTMTFLIGKTVDYNVELLEKERAEFVGKNENYSNEEIDFIKDALLEVKNNINLNYDTSKEIIEYGWPSILAPNILIF